MQMCCKCQSSATVDVTKVQPVYTGNVEASNREVVKFVTPTAVKVGFKKPRFFSFFKNLKSQKVRILGL